MNTQNDLDFGIENEQASDTEALTIKSANLITIRLVLNSAYMDDILSCLEKAIQDSNGYFDDEPVIIDANSISSDLDWNLLIKNIKKHNLMPAGFDAKGNNVKLAKAIGLAHFDLSTPIRNIKKQAPTKKILEQAKPVQSKPKTTANTQTSSNQPMPSPAASNIPTKIIERPLRSGQRIYAAGSDLIIIGMVSQGAEVIADGNIHVYGPLRGKAMAGAAGNTNAKIFTTQLEPELLAIAGVFKVFESTEDNPVNNQSALIELSNNSLEIKGL